MGTEKTENTMVHSQSQTEMYSTLGNMDRLTQTKLQRDEKKNVLMDVESIKEQLEKQLRMNRIETTKVENVNFGSAKLIKNDALVLNFNKDIQKIERLQNRINDKRNSNLEYTSPLQVVYSEPNQDTSDGILFYVAIKFKKDFGMSEHPDYDEDTSEADSGMGESGNSRSGESPQLDEDELDSASAANIVLTKDKISNEFNIGKTTLRTVVGKEGRQKLKPKLVKTPASEEKAEKLLLREEIKKRYTILRRKKQRVNLLGNQNVKNDDGLQKVTKPMWFVPGQNSFHVNINPSFSSQQPKCYSFQCKPRVRTHK